MKIVYAKSSTAVGGPHGGVWRLTPGQPWSADDPVVKANPNAFTELPERVMTSRGEVLVEQATAAPGEKRARK